MEGERAKRVLTGKNEIVSNKGALLPSPTFFLPHQPPTPSLPLLSHSAIFTRTLCSLQGHFVTSIFEGLKTQIETLPKGDNFSQQTYLTGRL